jgi:integrase
MARIFERNKIIKIAEEMPNLTRPRYRYKSRDRALFCLTYLTGARVGELVKRVRKKDFEFARIQDKDFLVIELYTEKNRRHPIRKIPIPIEKEERLVSFILEYLDELGDRSKLFDFTKQRAWQIIGSVLRKYKRRNRKNKFMNANHFLRHCRLTHLVTIYDFTDQDLVKFTGWSNSIPATIYSHLRFKDLARKMI